MIICVFFFESWFLSYLMIVFFILLFTSKFFKPQASNSSVILLTYINISFLYFIKILLYILINAFFVWFFFPILWNFIKKTGLILQTFGAGNGPDQDEYFLNTLKNACDRGLVVVNVTQCHRGCVEAHYATGTALSEAGVVSGLDMTCEAALVKLGW